MGRTRGERHAKRRSDATVDPARVFELRVRNRLAFPAIAQLLGASEAACRAAVKPLLAALEGHDLGDAYRQHEAELLDVVSSKIVANMLDPKRLRAASLNNLAFAFSRLHEARRLQRGESTANVGVKADVVLRAAKRRVGVELRDQGRAAELPEATGVPLEASPITSIMSTSAVPATIPAVQLEPATLDAGV